MAGHGWSQLPRRVVLWHWFDGRQSVCGRMLGKRDIARTVYRPEPLVGPVCWHCRRAVDARAARAG